MRLRLLLPLAWGLVACGAAAPPPAQSAVVVPPPAPAASSAAPAVSAAPAPAPSVTAAAAQGPQGGPRPTRLPGSPIHFTGGDGSSQAAAIVILGAQGEMDGVAAEYNYLEIVYGPRNSAWTVQQQSLLEGGGRSFDALSVTFPGGATKVVYFDITDYFGKN